MRTGELAELCGVSRQVIHNYTLMGLVRPARRTPSGYRLYAKRTVKRVKLIRSLLDSGYTLRSLGETFFKNR